MFRIARCTATAMTAATAAAMYNSMFYMHTKHVGGTDANLTTEHHMSIIQASHARPASRKHSTLAIIGHARRTLVNERC